MSREKISTKFYFCDPERARTCPRPACCYQNHKYKDLPGLCRTTTKPEWARLDEAGQPIERRPED